MIQIQARDRSVVRESIAAGRWTSRRGGLRAPRTPLGGASRRHTAPSRGAALVRQKARRRPLRRGTRAGADAGAPVRAPGEAGPRGPGCARAHREREELQALGPAASEPWLAWDHRALVRPSRAAWRTAATRRMTASAGWSSSSARPITRCEQNAGPSACLMPAD